MAWLADLRTILVIWGDEQAVSGTANKNSVGREQTQLLGEEEEEERKQVANGAGQNKQRITVARQVVEKRAVRRRESRGKQRGVQGEWQREGQSNGTMGEGDNRTGKQHMKQ